MRVRPFAWGTLALALLAAAPPSNPVSLRPGEPIERELSAGESQVFQVDLTPGQAWRLAVEQRGIDVVVEVSAPDGKRLAAVDSPLDRQGPETVLIEPSMPGVFRVEIRAHEPAAPAGRYEIRIEEADRQRLDAERAVTRAGERYLEGTAEARRQAIAEYKKALADWRTLGDRRQEARALYALAVLSRLVNDTRPALAWGQEVLPLWQSLGDRLWEGATWNEIGLDRWLLGESAEGKAAFEQALALQRQIGDRYGEGVSLSNLCLMDLSRGELRAGLACYDKALPVLHEVQAQGLEGSALLSVGRVYDVLGEPDQARDRYQQALARMRATKPMPSTAGPVFERLPGSRQEAEAIAALAPANSRVALGFDASRSEALSDRLSAYRIVHFATHGVIDAEHPALSGLALSMVDRTGQPQAGFLHLHDLYNLRLNADLVVLSGCRTALGKEVRGEGLIGLTRGFLYAGAPRVVASLWRVEDLATAALMTRFYHALWIERLRPAAALRAAQLSLRQQRRWRDPYFWAGFVLQGDWR